LPRCQTRISLLLLVALSAEECQFPEVFLPIKKTQIFLIHYSMHRLYISHFRRLIEK
jgi:hypothetical protein